MSGRLGTETVGSQVQALRDGFWYLGTIAEQPRVVGDSDRGGDATTWSIQCDADPTGLLYEADRICIWSSSEAGHVFAGNPDYHYPDARLATHDLPTAMSIVARNPTLLGFNVQLVPGSRVEYHVAASNTGTWKKATIDAIDVKGRRITLLPAGESCETLSIDYSEVRCDLDDRHTEWQIMFTRRGAGKIARIPAPMTQGCWVAVQRSEALLPVTSSELLFQDGWSGDNARCRIVEYSTGPGNTRATGTKFYVGWKRPGRGEGLADGLKGLGLFHSLQAADVEQGSVGNCWFMSAVAAIAHSAPHCIERLFLQRNLSASGRYDVRLWSLKESRWVTHTIDDRLPVLGYDSPSGLQLAYAKISADNELWPCLLEKAMAKHMGGYAAMDGGASTFAFGTLIGCPQDKLVSASHCANGDWNLWKMRWSDDHASDPEYYDDVRFPADEFLDLLSHSMDILMCASTPCAAENPRDVGLSGGHVYSILEVRRDVAGQRGLHMLRLRDPCSYGMSSGYTGDWTLGGNGVNPSKLWTENPDVCRALLHTADCPETEFDEAWASFWITYSDFCKYFGSVCIAGQHLVPGPDDEAGAHPHQGSMEVGTRVHVKKEDTWWQGSIVDVSDDSSLVVQCDADEPGEVVTTKELLTWVEPGNGSSFDVGEDLVVYEREQHDVPTAMAIVLNNAETIGFNLQLEVGSRVECKYRDRGWVKAEIISLPGKGHEGSFRVRGVDDTYGSFEVLTSNIRYDMSDTETVWNTVIVRKGAQLIDHFHDHGHTRGEYWTCLMPKSGPLWQTFFPTRYTIPS